MLTTTVDGPLGPTTSPPSMAPWVIMYIRIYSSITFVKTTNHYGVKRRKIKIFFFFFFFGFLHLCKNWSKLMVIVQSVSLRVQVIFIPGETF